MTTENINIHAPTRSTRAIHSVYRKFPGYGMGKVVLRYDDRCGNGHNTFSITVSSKAQYRNSFGGCMHDEIRKVFPEYRHLIKWHLVSVDGPMHYIANTLYFAQDQKVPTLAKLKEAERLLEAYKEATKDEPCEVFAATYMKELASLRAGVSIARSRYERAEGPNLKSARSSACAPRATIEQLQSKEWLEARLPKLLADFYQAMEATFNNVEGA